jgi:hypothetical protein
MEMGIRVNSQKFGNSMGVLNPTLTPGTPLLTFTYFQKLLTTMCKGWVFITVRIPALKIKLNGPCHKTVRTHPWPQLPEVRSQSLEIRLPPQINVPSYRMPAWYGNCPAIASWPPNIFGAIRTGAPSEIQMNPLVNISVTTKCTYIPKHTILHNYSIEDLG